MSGKRVAPWIAGAVGLVLVALLVLLAVAKPSTDSASSPLLGKAAPAVKSTTTDGKPFELARDRKSTRLNSSH